ncbi:Uncharacterised protein [uncultured archaeon]|nr:Uncharacterised protein [uncultured archaeon]
MKGLKGGEMRKIFLLFAVFLMAISLVLAVEDVSANSRENFGKEVSASSGNYTTHDGESVEIQRNGELKIHSGDIEVNSSLEITTEKNESDNSTKFATNLSNGRHAEIKIMPSTASATAIARLKLVNCIASEGCTIELKEVGSQNQTKAVYEVKAQKNSKVLGVFNAKMDVQTQVDAETGDVVQTKKPWWAFLAVESNQ